MPTKPTGRPPGRPRKPPRPKAPPLPRGRPKGSRNLPKDLPSFLERIREPVETPPAKPKRKPGGPWAGKTPEERKAYSAHIRAIKKAKGGPNGGGRRTGVPHHLTVAKLEFIRQRRLPMVERLISIMKKNGTIPEDDLRAEAAMKTLLGLLTEEISAKDTIAACKTILDFTKQKPAHKIDATITSEQLLDDVANLVLSEQDLADAGLEDDPEE